MTRCKVHSRIARKCPTILSFLVFIAMSAIPVFAGTNPNVTFVLHAQSGHTGGCVTGHPNCLTVRPTVNVLPNGDYRVFFYLNNIAAVEGVQSAFQWDPSWHLLGSSWSCRSGQLTATEPDPGSNGGPRAGTIATAFDCVSGPTLAIIGYMDFVTGPTGCLSQVQSEYPAGDHVVDCSNGIDQADPVQEPARFGRICVAAGGQDACDPPAPPPPPAPPAIGVIPPAIDFACVHVGSFADATVHLMNLTPDPTSILEVTNVTIMGGGLSIVGELPLPLSIPGDSTTVPVTVRFAPPNQNPTVGRLTVVASNALNSPYTVSITGTSCQEQSFDASFDPDQFIINFAPNAVIPPQDPQGPLVAFEFLVPGLRASLEGAGVVWLRKLLPDFTPDDIYSTNKLSEPVLLVDMSRIYVASLADGFQVVAAVDSLDTHPGIEYAEPDHIYKAGSPSDPLLSKQWALENTAQLGQGFVIDQDMNAPEGWAIYDPRLAPPPGPPHGTTQLSRVALLDTGIDASHEDFCFTDPSGRHCKMQNLINYTGEPNQDTSPTSHGTALSGMIGAVGDNDIGITGVNFGDWSVTVDGFKVLNADEQGNATNIAMAIDAVRTAGTYDIVNMSFIQRDWNTTFYYATINAALSGDFLVGAMGHGSEPFPAGHDHTVFGVGAVWGDGQRWEDVRIPSCPVGLQSGTGSWIDVVAPGGRALATTKRSSAYYDLVPRPPDVPGWCQANGFPGGTSAAAAHASGMAALVASYWKATPNRPPVEGDDLAQILQLSARHPNGAGSWDQFIGYGLIRADRALGWVSPTLLIEKRNSGQLTQGEVTEEVHDFLGVPGLADGEYQVVVYPMIGSFTLANHNAQSPPTVWYRMSGTKGWNHAPPQGGNASLTNYNIDPPSYAQFSGRQSLTYTFVTWVYKVFRLNGQFVDWFPCEPEEARIAITAIGLPSNPISVEEPTADQHSRVIAFPNPGAPTSRFLLDLSQSGRASLRIYDLAGRLVRILSDEPLTAGGHMVSWDGRNGKGERVAGGIYFYELELNGKGVARDKIAIKP